MATRPSSLPRWAETAGGTPSSNIADPTSAKKDAGWADSEKPPAGFLNWLQNTVYRWIKYLDESADSGVFGFGTDGALVFDGISNVAGLTPVGNAYTMDRHLFPTNMTVATGVTVNTSGFGIWGTGTLTLAGTAKIDNSGSDASGHTGGAIPISGIWHGGAGANGGAASTIGGSTTLSNSLGGSGGVGGTSDDAHTGGTVTNTAAGAEKGAIRLAQSFTSGFLFGSMGCTVPTAGSGGSGGGGGGGGSQGGGGGAGGGLILVMFRTLNFSSSCTVWAKGGAGAAGDAGGGFYAGSGGGGGGGVVLLGYRDTLGTAPNTRVSVAGGAGGGGSGAGAAGNSGLALILAL